MLFLCKSTVNKSFFSRQFSSPSCSLYAKSLQDGFSSRGSSSKGFPSRGSSSRGFPSKGSSSKGFSPKSFLTRSPPPKHDIFKTKGIQKKSKHFEKTGFPQKNARSQKNSKPLEEKLGYGEYSGLKNVEEEILRGAKTYIEKIQDFNELKLLPEVREAVIKNIKNHSILNNEAVLNPEQKSPSLKYIRPTPIQIAAIKIISRKLMDPHLNTYTIAAETGSGKTWAYMAPLVDFLKNEELQKDWINKSHKGGIRSIVMAPTHELTEQIYQNIESIEQDLGLHVFKWDVGKSYNDFIEAYKNRIDILVTTPGKVDSIKNIRMIQRPDIMLTKVKFLVLDEADTLLDGSWVDSTHSAISKMVNLTNIILCSATIPSQFNKTVARMFPSATPIVTPSIHRIPKRIRLITVDADVQPYNGSKMKALAQSLYAIHNDGTEAGFEKRVLIFVNEKQDVHKVADRLRTEFNHDAIGLTGEDSAEVRHEKVLPFVSPPRKLADLVQEEKKENALQDEDFDGGDDNIEIVEGSNIVLQKKVKNKVQRHMRVLVTTDLLSRGLNFYGVNNVILYDVPKTSSDLVHRAGRTGRMNQSGRVFLIVDRYSKNKQYVKRLPKTVRNHGLIV